MCELRAIKLLQAELLYTFANFLTFLMIKLLVWEEMELLSSGWITRINLNQFLYLRHYVILPNRPSLIHFWKCILERIVWIGQSIILSIMYAANVLVITNLCRYDAVEVARAYSGPKRTILIDQGSADNFLLADMLKPQALLSIKNSLLDFNYLLRNGYDHGYYYIQTFIEEHFEHHIKQWEN